MPYVNEATPSLASRIGIRSSQRVAFVDDTTAHRGILRRDMLTTPVTGRRKETARRMFGTPGEQVPNNFASDPPETPKGKQQYSNAAESGHRDVLEAINSLRFESKEEWRGITRAVNELRVDLKVVQKNQEQLQMRVLEGEETLAEQADVLTAHGHQIGELFTAVDKIQKFLDADVDRKRPEDSASMRSDAAEGFYPKNSTCAFNVQFTSTQATHADMRDYLKDTITSTAGVVPSSLKRIEIIGATNQENGVKTQSWRFVWQDCQIAGLIIRAKSAIKKKLHILMTDDLSLEERELKRSRMWAYKLLQEEGKCWIQWRFAEIYINRTAEVDKNIVDAEGRPKMIHRGMWMRMKEHDYEELEEELDQEHGAGGSGGAAGGGEF